MVIPSFHYDPDTADTYNHLNAALLSQSVLTEQRTGEDRREHSQHRQESAKTEVPSSESPEDKGGNEEGKNLPTFAFSTESGYRDERHESFASPTASPLLASLQSPLHTRNSSFGSSAEFSSQQNAEGDPAFQQMQTLGQRMTLHDPILVTHTNDPSGRTSTDTPQQRAQLQSSSQAPYFAPVFEEEGGPIQASATARVGTGNNTSAEGLDEGQDNGPSSSFPSYTYSLPSQESTAISSTNGASVPMLSLTDTGLQFDSSGQNENDGIQTSSTQDQNPSTSRAFQFPTRTQQQSMQNQWILGNNSEHSFMNSDAQAAAPYAALAQQQISAYGANSFNPGGSSQRPSSSSTGQHGSFQEPKRQDSSDDRVRKFLRLDVDMGFQAEREIINPSEMGPRKRSNSDFGLSYKEDGILQGDDIPSPPPYAVVPGGVSDKTPIAMQSGVDWATEAAKQRRMQQLAALGFQDNSVNGSNLDGMNNNQINTTSMDPLLLQKQQQQQQAENIYQQQMLQYQQNPASGPVRQRETSFSGRGAVAPYPGHGRAASSGSIASNSANGQSIFQSLQQQQLQLQQQQSQQNSLPTSDLHRSLSSRSGRVGRHSRLAQSEDLSQLARMSNPHEFLTRITAPDGGLAPPNTQPGMPSMGPPAHSTPQRSGLTRIDTSVPVHSSYATAPQMGMYGTAQYPRSQEDLQAMMNRYGSMRSAPSEAQYSQTETPAYTTLHPNNRTQGSAASPYEMDGSTIPIIQQVTTSATQAASASRRKNEAIHVCPIPGCGSTFTRKFNLNGHIRSHTGQRPYQCRAPGCGKSFARSFDLSRHEKLHAGVKPHTCETCGKAFARADALSRHLRNDAGAGGCAQRLSESDNGGTLDEGSRSSSNVAINEMGGVEMISMDDNGMQQDAYKSNITQDQIYDPSLALSAAAVAGSTVIGGIRKESKFKGHVL